MKKRMEPSGKGKGAEGRKKKKGLIDSRFQGLRGGFEIRLKKEGGPFPRRLFSRKPIVIAGLVREKKGLEIRRFEGVSPPPLGGPRLWLEVF